MFDEYIHGEKNAATVLTIYPRWFLLFIGPSSDFLRFFGFGTAGNDSDRFSFQEKRPFVSVMKGFRALAAWYIRGRRYHDSLVIQADYVKSLLQERWRIPISSGMAEILRIISNESGHICQKLSLLRC